MFLPLRGFYTSAQLLPRLVFKVVNRWTSVAASHGADTTLRLAGTVLSDRELPLTQESVIISSLISTWASYTLSCCSFFFPICSGIPSMYYRMFLYMKESLKCTQTAFSLIQPLWNSFSNPGSWYSCALWPIKISHTLLQTQQTPQANSTTGEQSVSRILPRIKMINFSTVHGFNVAADQYIGQCKLLSSLSCWDHLTKEINQIYGSNGSLSQFEKFLFSFFFFKSSHPGHAWKDFSDSESQQRSQNFLNIFMWIICKREVFVVKGIATFFFSAEVRVACKPYVHASCWRTRGLRKLFILCCKCHNSFGAGPCVDQGSKVKGLFSGLMK